MGFFLYPVVQNTIFLKSELAGKHFKSSDIDLAQTKGWRKLVRILHDWL